MRIAASAPGKFVLSGEYAVLDGAPAICAAVDRRAVVTIEAHQGDHHVVRAPAYTQATGRFNAHSGRVGWLQGGRDFALFEAVWNASRPGPFPGSLHITLDTAAFHDPGSGSKIGLGSSAALTAALAAALNATGGGCAGDVAHAAHRLFQGGAGSGVDIACSLAGGVIEYRMANEKFTRVAWPDGLYFSVLWSGIAAGTQGRLAQFGAEPGSPARRALSEAAASVVAEFRGGQAATAVAALADYTQALLQFDERHGLGIFDAGHASLARRAAGSDVVYKPCGAGGGDVGIALATDRSSLASFEDMASCSGFIPLGLRIEPRGAALHDKDEN